jgi:hypothetical protein
MNVNDRIKKYINGLEKVTVISALRTNGCGSYSLPRCHISNAITLNKTVLLPPLVK